MAAVRAQMPDLYVTLHTFGQQILVPFGYRVGARPPNYANMVSAVSAAITYALVADGRRAHRRRSHDGHERRQVHGRRLGESV